ncbi:MAG: hypothetical protein CVU79_07095 [Elusimicrobia bacterium HGW-Elusimicrobia-3]|nr:MAG: hypothetical protein CVU79_07095 [Elusimicrobia bacterium HGW-Elusimicrobia-3]
MVTNGFSARFGQAVSGLVSVTTRDGGDSWRGRIAYETDRPMTGVADLGLDRFVFQADGPLGRGITAVGIVDLSARIDFDPVNAPKPEDPRDPRATTSRPLPHNSGETWTAGGKVTIPLSQRLTGRLFGLATTEQRYLYDQRYKYEPEFAPGQRTDALLLTSHLQLLPAPTSRRPIIGDLRFGYFEREFVRGDVEAPDFTFGAFTGRPLDIRGQELARSQDTVAAREAQPGFNTPTFSDRTPWGVPGFFLGGASQGEISWNRFRELRTQLDMSVVLGQYAGLLPYANAWAAEIYASLPATLLIAGVTVLYLFVMRRLSRQIFEKLNLKLSRERELKDAMMRKFSELNATAQLGVLAHRIAHDMRGPISCIFGYLEMEMAKTKAPEDLEVLRGVRETAAAMVESLQGITRFGKQGGPGCETIHLSDMMKDLVAIASFSPLSKGVSFKLDGPEINNIAISACRQDLQQAFFNVIKNAVEAVSGNNDQKLVAIGIERVGQDARVTISDNGPGMSEEALRNVFRKSLTTKSDGTGVGLMITRDLLMRNSGVIKLRNRNPGGLSAEITLPAA